MRYLSFLLLLVSCTTLNPVEEVDVCASVDSVTHTVYETKEFVSTTCENMKLLTTFKDQDIFAYE